jgi:hypothetical protein
MRFMFIKSSVDSQQTVRQRLKGYVAKGGCGILSFQSATELPTWNNKKQ